MSMDDILKLLVESRQQGQSPRPSQGNDPMTELIGGLLGGGSTGSQGGAMSDILGSLLGGGQPAPGGSNQQDPLSSVLGGLMGGGQQQPANQPQGSAGGMLGGLLGNSPGGSQSGLGGIMSMLEMMTGGGQQPGFGQSALTSNNPLMGLLQPLIKPLADKLKISPELATIIVSFVLQKLLAHHPTSGRDSNQFNLDQMLSQLSSGKLDPNLIKNSGMVEELSRATGMNQAMASKSLNTAFTMVGKRALQAAGSSTPARKASGGVKRA